MFDTIRLKLSPTTVSDSYLLYKFIQIKYCEDFFLDNKIKSLNDCKNYINEILVKQFLSRGFSSFTIKLKNNNEKIGFCAFVFNKRLNCFEFKIAILEQYQGLGYAFESGMLLLNAAKLNFNLDCISVNTKLENQEFIGLLTKLNFINIRSFTEFFTQKDGKLFVKCVKFNDN